MKIEQTPVPARESHKGEYVARLGKEEIKSLFSLFVGKPDSLTKIFPKQAFITVPDLEEIHHRIVEKLNQHNVPHADFSITIAFDKNTIKELTHEEFITQRWVGAELTKSITVRWDFLVVLPSFKLPQRHTLTLRMVAEPTAKDVLQMALSTDFEKASFDEIELAPTFCRVDFISSLLSEELVNIVTAWHEALPKPSTSGSIWRFLRRRESFVHQLIHQMFRLLGALVSLGALAYLLRTNVSGQLSSHFATILAVWLFVSWMFVDFIETIGHHVALGALRSLGASGRTVLLRLTRGDNNRQKELEEANKRNIRAFVTRVVISLVLNIIAGLITTLLFSWNQ